MQNILKIFFSDLKGLVKNKFALAIAIGVCFLPSLYAWFNIYSNWDPYANTSKIKVAVASDDAGWTKSDDEYVNMGSQVIDNLRENNAIDWQFVDSADAIDGVYTGKYYAAIVIGENFSASMYNFYENDLQRPRVTYYENQKKNAVASKITDSAKSTVQNSINSSFVSVVTETIVEGLNGFASEADEDNQLDTMITQLENISSNIERYQDMIDKLIDCNNTLSGNLSTAGGTLSTASDAFVGNISNLENAQSQTMESLDSLSEGLDKSLKMLSEELTSVSETLGKEEITAGDLASAQESLENANELINGIGSVANSGVITDQETQDSIQGVLDSMQNATDTTIAAVDNVSQNVPEGALPGTDVVMTDSQKQALKLAVDLINAVLPLVEKQLQSDIATLKVDLNAAYSNMIQSMESMGSGLDGTGNALNGLSATVLSVNGSLSGTKVILADTGEKIIDLTEKLKTIQETGSYEEFLSYLESDPESAAEFFSNPVQTETIPIYPANNYGSSVTPFYTILALWVGCVILVSIMKVDVENVPGAKQMRPYEIYFGRFLLFMLMGQLQALITVLGDLFLLKVQCASPGLFYFDAAFSSLIFCLIIYTLTTSFGDIGKAVVVIIMVLQIAGSSGTYPIEILPSFNQKIYIYFPFPYAINAMRESMFGLYHDDFGVYIGQLGIFGLISLFVGLVIRRPFIKINTFVEHRMKDTKMM